MPRYEISAPDGRKFEITAPEGATQEEVLAYAQSNFGPAPEEAGILSGGISALSRGISSFGDVGSGYNLAGQKMFGTDQDVAKQMQAIKQEQAQPVQNPSLTFADLQRIYKTKGLPAALAQVPKYTTEQLLESAPQMALPLAVGEGVTAATAPVIGPFAPAAGFLAGMGTYGAQQFGNLMQRQGQEISQPEDVSVGRAATAAAIQAPLGYFVDKFTAGLGGLGEKGIFEAAKVLTERKAAGEIGNLGVVKGLAAQAGKGAVSGFIAEAPTEALEQALERWQAGLSLTDDNAKQEYLEAAMGAGLPGALIGGASRARQTYKEAKAMGEEPTAPAPAPVPTPVQAPVEAPIQAAPPNVETSSQDLQAMQDELDGKPIPNVPSSTDTANQTVARTEAAPQPGPIANPEPIGLYERLGMPEGPARENDKNEELNLDDAKLLKKMIVKTVDDGLKTGKTRQQIIDQLDALTKGGIRPNDFQRINDYLTEKNVTEQPKPALEAPKVEELIATAPKLPPNVEQVANIPMGENTEYHVLKTPTGYTANMFDVDAGKYIPGSARMFSNKTFGDEAQANALNFVREQAVKAHKFNEPAPTEKPAEVKKEEPNVPKEEKKTLNLPKKILPTHLSPEFQAIYEHHLKSAEAANKATSMVKVGTATQAQAKPFIDQAEKARADMYEALLKEENLSPENKETIDLARRAIDANQRGFAEGLLSNVIRSNSATPKDMEFRRSRTAELEAMAKPKEATPVKETYNLDTLLENHELDKKRLDNFGKFDDRTKESIAKTNEYLQKLTDAINAKGFNVFEGNRTSMPQDVEDLKKTFTNLHAGATRLLLDTQHVAGKQARKSKKSYGEQNVEIQAAQNKLNKSHIEQNKDIEKARDLLGKIKKEEPIAPKVEEKLPPEELKVEEEKPTAAIEPKIKVGKSKLTPAPILEKLAQPAVDGINRSNDLVNQLTESMPTVKDPDAHQKAIDDLNSTADILKDKGQVAVNEMARNNKMTPGEQNRAIQKANAELKKALIEHDKSIKAAKKLITPTKTRVKKIPPPLELTNKTEDELYLEKLNKDLEYAEMARRQVKTTGLFGALRGRLKASEVNDISPEKKYTQLKNKNGGADLADIVSSGDLNEYLPYGMRHDHPNFDDKQSSEYIKEKLREDPPNYMTYDAEREIEKITGEIEDLRGNIKELEDQIKEQLELKDVNLLLEEAFNEQREADLADTVIEPEDENRVFEPSKAQLELTGQTPDEVRAAERAKEDRLKAEKEAEAKAKADEGVGEFTLTGSNRPADIAAAKGQEDLFSEAPEQRALSNIKQDMVRFASGMSGVSDLESGVKARGSHQNHGIGVDVGLLSNNAIDSLAHAILNMNVPVFIDSGAFSNFRQNLKGNGPKPLDFNKILAKYDQITEAIHNLNEDEKTDYPRPIIVMPDIVGDQAGSLALIDKHKDWIIPEIKGNITQPMIPIQNGALTLSQAYDHVVKTLGTDDFIVGVPSNAEAITRDQLADFLRESKPKKIHFLGAASDSKLNPLLNIVANESPNTQVTADASKVRSAILDGVSKGKTREQSIIDALAEEDDPGVLLAKFGPQITDESNIIDGTDLVKEVGNEEQLLLIADESNKLTANEKAVLEEEYGANHGSNEFLERLHNDVFNFITQGAKAIKNRIRPIINKIANSLLSVAMVLNPNFITKPEIIAVPQYETRVETVYADVPADAKAKMSPAAQQIYSVVYPTLKEELMKNNKFFIVTDKPMARNFIFNPDGSLLMDKKVLLSKSMGDFLPSGSNEIDANKITPAGLYNLGLRDASRSKGEAETAGEYDYGKVFVIEHAGEGRHGPYSMTIMHSVWTHEKDAAQRLAALKTEAPNVSRYSFGCINVDKATFGELVNNHLSQMDGAKLFIVPDSATNAMDFVNGKATYRDDMMRQRVEPLTKEIKTPIKEAKKPGEEQIAAKEEEYQIPLNAAVRNFNMPIYPGAQTTMEIDRKNAVQEYAKVNQRRAYVLKEVAKQGSSLSLQQELTNLNALAKNLKDYIEDTKDQARTAGDFDTYARQLLNNYEKAKRNGLPEEGIAKEVYDVIHAAYEKAPFLLEGLKLSVIQSKDIFNSTLGEFDLAEQIVKLYKKTAGVIKAEIVRHELAHAMEQMMSPAAKVALIEAWERDFKATVKKSQNPQAKNYIQAVEMFFANPSNATYDAAVAAIPTVPKTGNKEKDREEFNNWYQFLTPSEYWAVNAEKLMHKKLGSGWDRFVLAMRRLFEGLKKVIGFNHRSEVYKVFNDIFSRKPNERIGQSIANVAAGIGVSLKSQGQIFPPAPQPQQVAPLSPQGPQGKMFPRGTRQRTNYQGKAPPISAFDSGEDTKLEKFLHDWVDKYTEIKSVQKLITDTGKDIDDRFNPYQKEELYHKKVATKIKNFLMGELRPVIGSMIKDKISVPEFEEYLHMRHAKERNAWVATRNPSMPDGGSGVLNAEVDQYFNNLDPKKEAMLNSLGKKIDEMVYKNQEELVKGGIETQETIDALRAQFNHYVPLERDDVDFANKGTGLGAGFSTRGSSFKRAFGSNKKVINIFENLALQRERSIIRSEKAVVGRALFGLALKYPNPKFWLPVNPDAIKDKAAFLKEITDMGGSPTDAYNLMQEPKVAGFDKNGEVVYKVNPALRSSPNVFPVRINGRDRYVYFNPQDPRAMRMAEAIKNLDTEQLDAVMGTIGNVTRMLAAVNTQYNPVFGLWNFLRDTGGAAFNLTTTPIANKKFQVMSDTLPALKGIYTYLRDERDGKTQDPNYKPTKWAAIYKQYNDAGGGVGFKDQFSRGKGDLSVIEKEMKKLDRGNVRKVADSFFNLLSDYNDAMENAVRLSVFKAALDKNLSEDKAASISKNITVNFNRKGAKTPYAAALYAFFNASVQGSARLLETLRGPAGKKIMAGGFAVGVIQAFLLAAAGYDDDEPPEFLKDKNFIIPLPDGKYAVVPMPLGINLFPGIGRIATEAIFRSMGVTSGSKSATGKMADVASLISDTFNPLGSGSLTQSLSPTLLDPILAVSQNKDAFGRPIYRADQATNPTPGYTRSREGATEISKNIAEFLNYVSGGDKYKQGSWSPTADEIDYLAGQYGGGAAREAMKLGETLKAPFTGEELPSYRIPILGKMYGETESPAAIQDKFYKNITLMAGHEKEVKGLLKDKINPREYLQENPDAKLWQAANATENQVNALNKQRRMLISKDAPQERIDRVNQLKVNAMKRFNDRVSQAQTQ